MPSAARKAGLGQSVEELAESAAGKARKARGAADDIIDPSKPIVHEAYDNPPIQPMRQPSQQHKHGVERWKFWQANPLLREAVEWEVFNIIADMAEDGFRAAGDYIDDFLGGKVKAVFYADHKNMGSFNASNAPGILKISPFGRKLQVRDAHDIAGTIIHEYMHFKGYNEFMAHWTQFMFMMRLTLKNPGLEFANHARHLAQFKNMLTGSSPKAAERWMIDYVVDKGYNLAKYGGNMNDFIRGVTNFAGGRYKEIEAVLKTGFFPEEFLPKTLRGS